MQINAALVVGLFVAAALSGCVGSEAGPEGSSEPTSAPIEAAPAEFDDDTGAIEGVVHDDSLAPVAGAQVAILDSDVPSTVSSVDGRFTFSRLGPGSYKVAAQKLGYESTVKVVAVEVGVAASVDLTLIPLAIQESHMKTMQNKGMVACGTSVRPVVGVAICGLPGLNTALNDKFLINWEIMEPTEDWKSSVHELSWKSNQVLSQGLDMVWEIRNCPNDNDVTFAEKAGRSPLFDIADEDKIEKVIDNAANNKGCSTSKEMCNEDFCKIYSRIFSTASTTNQAVDVGLTWQQNYEAYWSVFFGEPAPENWTAVQDT